MIGAFRQQLHSDRGIAIAQGLILLNLVAMTRAFALVNLIELTLWLLFLFNKTLRQRFLESVKDPRIGLVMVFWAWIALSMLWSPAPWPERFDDWLSWRKLLLFPMAFSVFREDSAKRLVWWVLIGVAAGYMVMSWLGFWGVVILNRAPENVLENYATQGVVFSAAAFLCLLITIDRTVNRLPRVLCGMLVLGFISSILLVSSGRSGYLFLLVVAAGFGFWAFPKTRLLASAGLVVTLCFSLIVSESTRTRIAQGFNEIETAYSSESFTSLGIRTVMWANSMRMISEAPLLGSGSGGYSIEYEKWASQFDGWRALISDDPHQQYLHIAAEYGLIGLAIFLAALFLCALTPVHSVTIFSGLIILAATAANGFANGHFSAFVEGRLLWILLGAMLAATVPYSYQRGVVVR